MGALIPISAEKLVWFRMLIAVFGIFFFAKIIKKINLKIPIFLVIKFILTGLIIALHWITFFGAIKVSNVSVTLACLASATLFTALLEPLVFKRKLIGYEIIFGIIVIIGLYLIFHFETQYKLGIIYSLISAFLASVFTVINGTFAKKHEPSVVSVYEMFGGFIGITIYFFATFQLDKTIFQISYIDAIYLIILGTICTAFALIVSITVMKELTPYSVIMAINLEPIYGIILAFFIFGEKEYMSSGFYIGTLVILLTLFINGYLKNKARRENKTLKE